MTSYYCLGSSATGCSRNTSACRSGGAQRALTAALHICRRYGIVQPIKETDAHCEASQCGSLRRCDVNFLAIVQKDTPKETQWLKAQDLSMKTRPARGTLLTQKTIGASISGWSGNSFTCTNLGRWLAWPWLTSKLQANRQKGTACRVSKRGPLPRCGSTV